MDRSRTIKTLAALLASLTVGTFVLLALETRPARPGKMIPLTVRQDHDDAILKQVQSHRVPVRPDQWLNIVVHDSFCDLSGDPTTDCHFVIYGPESGDLDGELRATQRWQEQTRGAHITAVGTDYNAMTLGICLEGDFAQREPSAKQQRTLEALTRALQRKVSIGRERVYMHEDLAASPCPGPLFPVDMYRESLLGRQR